MFNNIKELLGVTVVDQDGNKLGPIKEVYINDGTNEIDFVALRHRIFNVGEALAPTHGASLNDDTFTLPYPKDTIAECPEFTDSGYITPEEQVKFYRYYSLNDLADEVERGYIVHDPEGSTSKGSRGSQSQYGALREEKRLEDAAEDDK